MVRRGERRTDKVGVARETEHGLGLILQRLKLATEGNLLLELGRIAKKKDREDQGTCDGRVIPRLENLSFKATLAETLLGD